MKVLLVGLTIVAGAIGAGFGYAGIKTATLPTGTGSGTVPSTVIESTPPSENGGRFPEGYVSGNAIYEDTAQNSAPDTAQATARNTVTQRTANNSSASPAAPVTANSDTSFTLSSSDLNEMVTDAIASRPYTAPILDAAKDITTAIKNDRIESGAKINLSDLPLDALPTEGRQAVEQLTQTFPFLANRDVYVGVEGAPRIVNGELSLEDTYVRFGQLRLPVGRVADQLGISQGEIEQQIGALLDQQDMSLSDVRIEDGRLVIVGQ
ncbi:MAG: hypothetical protein AB8B99_03475 [Phormidesmis sp.]